LKELLKKLKNKFTSYLRRLHYITIHNDSRKETSERLSYIKKKFDKLTPKMQSKNNHLNKLKELYGPFNFFAEFFKFRKMESSKSISIFNIQFDSLRVNIYKQELEFSDKEKFNFKINYAIDESKLNFFIKNKSDSEFISNHLSMILNRSG
jgi:hypothetical protein